MDSINRQELIDLAPTYLLVVDLEATCCDSDTIPNAESEIIEVGAIMIELLTKQEKSSFTSFIQPVRHPTLTPFCTSLTTITQTEVDNAPLFDQVMTMLEEWLKPYQGSYVMGSWGNYDKNHVISDCQYFQIKNPVNAYHLNLKAAFAQKQGMKRCGLQKALEKVSLTFSGQHHRGIDDARNIARLLDFCI